MLSILVVILDYIKVNHPLNNGILSDGLILAAGKKFKTDKSDRYNFHYEQVEVRNDGRHNLAAFEILNN